MHHQLLRPGTWRSTLGGGGQRCTTAARSALAPTTTAAHRCRRRAAALAQSRALFSPYGGSSGRYASSSSPEQPGGAAAAAAAEQRLAAATPPARQAMLSNAISSAQAWQQLAELVAQVGHHMSANNVTHALTRLDELLRAERLLPQEGVQAEGLIEWLLRRGRELNATAQMGPQALGATAGALARLQQQRRQQQQQQQLQQRQQQQQLQLQQQQQQQQQLQQQRAAAAAAEQAAARQRAAERDALIQQLADAAVTQRHRLSPQGLNNLLTALAEIEESGMSADEIRQVLQLPGGGDTSARPQQQRQQQQPQQPQRQQQQPSSPPSPAQLQSSARQLGQLSPELALEWHDRALRDSLDQGLLPQGVDDSQLHGFLAREIDRAADRAAEAPPGGSPGPGGAALLSQVAARYGRLLGLDHLALLLHRLAELRQQEAAGSDAEVEALAGRLFQQLQPLVAGADAAALASIVSCCTDLQLLSKTLVQACLTRAQVLLQQQLQGARLPASAAFNGRRLGVLLHSLAVLGLRPSDAWLQLAATAAGELLPSCSVTDLERLASALVVMRVSPGRAWTTAAEVRLEQLAAAISSGSSIAAGGDADEGEAVNVRTALVSCVKALALLGGKDAARWHKQLAAEELQQQTPQQQPQRQQQQQQRQQQAAAGGSDAHVEHQLRKAASQQQARQHKQQQQQQQRAKQQAAAAGDRELTSLSSLDELMSQELLRQQQAQQQGTAAGGGPVSASRLPQPHTDVPVPAADGNSSRSSEPAAVEAAAPAAWAAEQAARWPQTRGEEAHTSPASELAQKLDDRQALVGSGSSKPKGRKQQQGPSSSGRDTKAQAAPGGDSSSSGRSKQQQARDAVEVLAALMAEVDSTATDEAAQAEVMRELGLGDDDSGATAELQEAADMVQQATQQLDDLQQRQEAAVASEAQQQPHGERRQGKHQHPPASKPQAAPASARAKAGSSRPLGSSGDPAFAAAAKALSGSQPPKRTLLLGILEAIEQQQQTLRAQLAEKAALKAVSTAAARQRAAAAAAKDPYARQLEQLQADYERAVQRAEAEKGGIRAAAAADVVSRLLPLLDAFEAAEAVLEQQAAAAGGGLQERDAADVLRVYQALHAQLLSIVKSQGGRVLGEDGELVGTPFDPATQEALMRQPVTHGVEDGDVVKVLRKGYAIGDRLVRPALVVVAYDE